MPEEGDRRVDALVASLTPAALRQAILAAAERRGVHEGSGVSLPDVIDALTGGADLGSGSEGWRRYLRLKNAIREGVAQIPEMRYVEGDA